MQALYQLSYIPALSTFKQLVAQGTCSWVSMLLLVLGDLPLRSHGQSLSAVAVGVTTLIETTPFPGRELA